MISWKGDILFVCLNGEIFLICEVDGVVKGRGSFFAVRKDCKLKNLARNFLEHDERGVGDFKEGFEFGGLIARGLGGKDGFGRIPRHETRVKTWSEAFFPGCDLIGFKTDFNGQILGDKVKKGKGAFGDFLGKS